MTIKDRDGGEWQPFINEYQQRQLRCVRGPRTGEVIHDPRLNAPRAEPRRRVGTVYGDEPSSAFFD